MAINEQFKNAAGEKQETTEWVRVVCWERTADIVAEYCKKGAPVFVAGKIRTRKWEADGVTKYTTEVVSNNLILLGTRGSVPAPTENDRYQGASDAEWVKGTEITDDDIPF
jgi:single-strand DNA-binding protein